MLIVFKKTPPNIKVHVHAISLLVVKYAWLQAILQAVTDRIEDKSVRRQASKPQMFSVHLLVSFHSFHGGHKPSSNSFSFPYVTLLEEPTTADKFKCHHSYLPNLRCAWQCLGREITARDRDIYSKET